MFRQMMNRRFSFVLAILTSAIVCAAQTRPQTTPAPAQQVDQKAVIQGTVMKAGAGQALKRARVSLRRQNQVQAQQQLQPEQAAAISTAINEVVNNLGAGAGIGVQIDQRIQSVIGAANTQAVTDDSGRFMFTGVEPGQYRI